MGWGWELRRGGGGGVGEEADIPGGSVRFSPSPPPNPRLANSEGLSVLLGFLPEAEWALLPSDKAGAFLFSLSLSLSYLKLSESLEGV